MNKETKKTLMEYGMNTNLLDDIEEMMIIDYKKEHKEKLLSVLCEFNYVLERGSLFNGKKLTGMKIRERGTKCFTSINYNHLDFRNVVLDGLFNGDDYNRLKRIARFIDIKPNSVYLLAPDNIKENLYNCISGIYLMINKTNRYKTFAYHPDAFPIRIK